MAREGGFDDEDFEGAERGRSQYRDASLRCAFFLIVVGETHLKATKVKVKRSSSHLSVCGTARDFLPKDVAAERSVDLEPSILRKLATLRTYLTRMATMQTLPTAQQQSTDYYCVSWVRHSIGHSGKRTWSASQD